MNNDMSRGFFVHSCFEPNEFAFLDRSLERGSTVVDARASEGLYTIFAAKRVRPEGLVLAFEPSPREFSRLQQNVHTIDQAPGDSALRLDGSRAGL